MAREALAAYQALDETALAIFFDLLVKEFSPDPEGVGRAADAYRLDPSQANLIRLQRAVETPRTRALPAAQHGLGRHRASWSTCGAGCSSSSPERPHYAGIDADLATC